MTNTPMVLTYAEVTLLPPTGGNTCRLCDGLRFHGPDMPTTCRVQDCFGEVRFERCWRCDGTGIEPQSIWVRLKNFFRRSAR